MNDNELQNLQDTGLSPSEIERIENFNNLLEEEVSDEPTFAPQEVSGDAVAGEATSQAQVPDDVVNEIVGTPGNDPDLIGTDFADDISALEGDDIVRGRLGNDTIDGGDGDDDLAGQGGNDSIDGGSGSDLINGDGTSSDDPSQEFNGGDNISGGGDRDFIFGGFENDVLNGDGGNDNLYGGEGNDTLDGGDGNDNLFGEDADDLLMGGNGDDFLVGDRSDSQSNSIGNDTLNGDNGNDTLIGGAESDSLNGGAGNDILTGVENRLTTFDFGADTVDTLSGGSGSDTIVLGGTNENGEEVVYYDDGNPQEEGTDDYALITDFGFGDKFDGVGSFGDYRLDTSPEDLPSGIAIYSEQGETDELIAIVQLSFGSSSSRQANSRSLSSIDTLDLSANSSDLSGNSSDLSANNLNVIEEAFI